MTDVLMIGFGRSFLRNLDGHVEPGCVRVVEEPDVYRNKRLDRECYAAVGEVVLAEYQQHDGFLGAALDAHGRRHVQAVIPGIEYAVEAAAAVAARLARPGASPAAARILRDKLLLRQVSSAAGIANPAWAEARSPEDVVRFMTASGAATGRSVTGRRSVLKPANRQASLGVCFLDDPHDVDGAWAETVNADEGPQLAGRPMRWRYLVEERIDGPEFSVEAFVRDGNVGFANITEKIVDAGSHPVELGHVIPAPLTDEEAGALRSATQALVHAVGYRTGVIHAEWVLGEHGPVLIECAGRAPGDMIFELMERVYGTNFYLAAVELLAGRGLPRIAPPNQAAATRFLTPPAGTVRDVRGLDRVARLEGVVAAEVTIGPGDRVWPLRSSWDRCGHVIAVAPTPGAARRRAEAAAQRIDIVVG